MTEKNNNRELMENIFIQAILDDAEGNLADSSAEVIFSEKHQLQMKRILKSSKHWYWSMVSNTKRRIAVVLIAAALFVLVGCTSYITRDAIVRFVHEVYERYFAVTIEQQSDEGAPELIETEYTLTYLPEGYEMTDYLSQLTAIQIVWSNEFGDEIIFKQNVSDGNVWQVDDEYVLYETKAIDKFQVNVYADASGAYRLYIWTDGCYNYTLHCPVKIDENIAEEMIMCIKAK